ncbi:hypothetical protein A9264_07040 [Vibrio sp. UCD-FRSSP16_10]|uniref:hypothetical protein n=1 Tax=unclassified Vibrio TaxID=2614977 RepID=UPI0007FF765E|nr:MULTISPECIES: hypothetical protein [unclassified Vibrio]OBT13417.1 hypothetical protein A9264_07040 [Vibrio sp. UCD-FRSSP16_10]OBT17927.1 hypothetical protein A9260_01030 [Vibrio sp. UCD-FRSSP16_30]
MLDLKITAKKSIELQQTLSAASQSETKVEFVIPSSIDLGDTFSAGDFFDSSFTQTRRFHKGKSISLMLLYIKILEKEQLPYESYKTSISLFAYLFINEIRSFKTTQQKEEQAVEEIIEKAKGHSNILSSFRRFSLEDDQKFERFRKVDAILSYEFEQYLLRQTAYVQNIKGATVARDYLSQLSMAEDEYRITQMYESIYSVKSIEAEDQEKLTRVFNQTDLQKKLLELPLRIHSTSKRVGEKERYLSLAIATGLIMLGFSVVIFQFRLMGLDTDLLFVMAIAALYVVRDVFKERIKSWVFDKIIRKKPRVVSAFNMPDKKTDLGTGETWFNSQPNSKVAIANRESISLFFKEIVSLKNFEYNGFKKIKTNTTIDLGAIMRCFPSENRDMYVYASSNKSRKVSISRRGRIEIKIHEKKNEPSGVKERTARYRVTFDRTKIIKLELLN